MVLYTPPKYSFTRVYNKVPLPLREMTNIDWSFLWSKSKCFYQKRYIPKNLWACRACFPTKVHKAPPLGGDWWKKLKENSIQKQRQVRVGGSEGTRGVQSSQGPLRAEATLVLYKTMKIKIKNRSKIPICWTQQDKHGFVFPFQLQEHLEGSEITITPIIRDKNNGFLSCRIKWSKTESELPDLEFLGSLSCPGCFIPPSAQPWGGCSSCTFKGLVQFSSVQFSSV